MESQPPRRLSQPPQMRKTIRIEREDAVVHVVLDRPDIRNAFNDVMIRELRRVFEQISTDPTVRVVVLTGEGKAFCAGADLHWMRRMVGFSYDENYEDSLNLAHLMREMYDCPKPIIGRINGPAIGGGTGLVAVCDIAVAVDTAMFAFTEVKLGLVPACISPYVLKRIGERYAREYFITGEPFDAVRALECGLINAVAPADALDEAVQTYADALLSSGPEAIATCKHMVRTVCLLRPDEVGPATADMIALRRVSDEGQEGMAAFLERRKPSWHPEAEGEG